ncbi:sugar ABC transporter permease [Streptomyces sp. AK010]|uniref:sugar ABC transporter permease n=1 Tax=Streptomyces sp. AK010 TaxID=2723074 RepID=UPI0016096CFE|nr:sugar ABC transporter permease [Streptomyces sp. AK010]MBB6417839.1 unsaturated chondroitin disaccharide hydrolase [Streptomyces sp. AK010]
MSARTNESSRPPEERRAPLGLTTAPAWAAPALASLLDRVAVTRAGTGGRFPLYADPDSGTWTTTARGSWTGGFWAGLLWLRARGSGDPSDREAARACTARLADWAEADTATRGLIFWYGTALADDDLDLRYRAARACLDDFDPELGLVPWGSAFGGPRLLARVDGVPGMVPLLATVDAEAARSHLRLHVDLYLRERLPRWSWQHTQGAGWTARADPPPGWSRGPAWLLLALAEAARLPGGDEFSGYVDALMPSHLVPPADAAHPGGPRDTSAAAVTALALLRLGFRDRAVAVLEELAGGHLTPDGRLLDGCYDLTAGTAVRHELVWGDFFMAYALAVLTGHVSTDVG